MKIILPLFVMLPRKTKEDKKFILNLNVFRNAHHHTMNDAKVAWKEVVRDALKAAKFWIEDIPDPPYLSTYTVFPGNNRAFDLANVLPAVQKFTDDALQELGVIKNDNIRFIFAINYRVGEMVKGEGHCELQIEAFR